MAVGIKGRNACCNAGGRSQERDFDVGKKTGKKAAARECVD